MAFDTVDHSILSIWSGIRSGKQGVLRVYLFSLYSCPFGVNKAGELEASPVLGASTLNVVAPHV